MAKVFWNPNVVGGLGDGSSWENAYTSITTAAAACTSGDVLVMAENAGDTGNAATTIAFTGSTAWNTPIYAMSSEVLTGTSTNYRASTSVQFASNDVSGADLTISGDNVVMYGVWLSAGDNINVSNGTNHALGYDNCTLEVGLNSSGLVTVSSRTACEMRNTTIKCNDWDSSVINVASRGSCRLYNVTVSSTDTTAAANDQIFNVGVDSWIEVIGGDFSAAPMPDLLQMNNSVNCYARIFGAHIGSTVTALVEDEQLNRASGVEIYVTDDSLSDRFYVLDSAGKFESDTTIYLNNAISAKATSLSTALEWYNPSRMKLTEFTANFLTAKTIDIEIAQDGTTTALNDDEIWFEVHYPDDTTVTLLVEDNKAAQPDSGATAHATSTASWTGLSGTNVKQTMSVTTTGTGREGVAIIYVCLAKPSTTVYIDPQISVS